MSREADVVVIGAGPAGYAAAIRSAQLGHAVVCIDKSIDRKGKPTLGGTCLNWGCIPSKALLDVSYTYARMSEYQKMGISLGDFDISISKMLAYKNSIVDKLTSGIEVLFKGNDVTYSPGTGRLGSGREVTYTSPDGSQETITAEHVILAPGSTPIDIPAARVDHDLIVDSTDALEF